ncbi:MAG: VOC family protein [Xenococcaceae cyanobacterium MO_188.B29]|nr:VOC family protein [Xenococcaceae cyanobacterium MO_188.B29]
MPTIKISHLDHLVLTVKDIEATCQFYTEILGMEEITFQGNRKALLFGKQKINLHQSQQEFEPKAQTPTPGSADLCLIIQDTIEDAIAHLQKHHIPILELPSQRTGAMGKITSIYIRDPDLNLIELSVYQ